MGSRSHLTQTWTFDLQKKEFLPGKYCNRRRAILPCNPKFFLCPPQCGVVASRKESLQFSFYAALQGGVLAMIVLAQLCEALNLFPEYALGLEHSAGHYIDLPSLLLVSRFFLWLAIALIKLLFGGEKAQSARTPVFVNRGTR